MVELNENLHRHPTTSVIPPVLNSVVNCAVNYSSVWGWITEESAEMPFKDSLPGLWSPRGLSNLPTRCLFLHLTPGAVIYSLSCGRSSFPPSLPDPLSRTVLEIYRKSIKLFGLEIPAAIDQLHELLIRPAEDLATLHKPEVETKL